MKNFLVRVSVPVYYDIQADNAREAEEKASVRFKAERKTWREPTIEVLLDDGIAKSFWDSLDAQIDEYKERHM